jgi:hypothetical protein
MGTKSGWIRRSLGIVLLALIMRKVFTGYEAMQTVKECKDQVATDYMVSMFWKSDWII